MKNILHDLYCGHISSFAELPFIATAEVKALQRNIEDERRYFTSKMSLDDCKRFQDFENLILQSTDDCEFRSFAYGFKLATMLMCSVYTD